MRRARQVPRTRISSLEYRHATERSGGLDMFLIREERGRGLGPDASEGSRRGPVNEGATTRNESAACERNRAVHGQACTTPQVRETAPATLPRWGSRVRIPSSAPVRRGCSPRITRALPHDSASMVRPGSRPEGVPPRSEHLLHQLEGHRRMRSLQFGHSGPRMPRMGEYLEANFRESMRGGCQRVHPPHHRVTAPGRQEPLPARTDSGERGAIRPPHQGIPRPPAPTARVACLPTIGSTGAVRRRGAVAGATFGTRYRRSPARRRSNPMSLPIEPWASHEQLAGRD